MNLVTICFLFLISNAWSQQLATGKKLTYSAIRNSFVAKSKQIADFVANIQPFENCNSSTQTKETETNDPLKPVVSMTYINRLKWIVRQKFKERVCYQRFQRCSEQLSAAFCASWTKNLTFYLWARNMAQEIMNGSEDGFRTIKCSLELLNHFSTNKRF